MNASDSAYGRTVRLLVADVTATLGAAHTAAVREIADGVQGLDLPDHSRKCVDDVQQYLHDTFVDATWPTCPRHPRHPLDYRDGAWWCPHDNRPVARLGELAAGPSPGETAA
ncbi:MAG TPA: hypothetical protein VKA84_11005 [Gemmatimonadaceae bacterium]|nr:hypothetical protein [Gemmatimonadaceae bacterium]